jgi:hypothetical protein
MLTDHILTNLAEGDCGAWVVDATTGDLFGIVVCGHSRTKCAYIMPAMHIFHDIQKVSVEEVQLPLVIPYYTRFKGSFPRQNPTSVLETKNLSTDAGRDLRFVPKSLEQSHIDDEKPTSRLDVANRIYPATSVIPTEEETLSQDPFLPSSSSEADSVLSASQLQKGINTMDIVLQPTIARLVQYKIRKIQDETGSTSITISMEPEKPGHLKVLFGGLPEQVLTDKMLIRETISMISDTYSAPKAP